MSATARRGTSPPAARVFNALVSFPATVAIPVFSAVRSPRPSRFSDPLCRFSEHTKGRILHFSTDQVQGAALLTLTRAGFYSECRCMRSKLRLFMLVHVFALESPGTGRPVGAVMLAPDARYASLATGSHTAIVRRFATPSQWAEVLEETSRLVVGPLPRESAISRLVIRKSELRVAFRESRELDIDRPELVVPRLDAVLRIVPLRTLSAGPDGVR